MALVRLMSTNRNAPIVVRKMYRPIDPIRLRRPTFGRTARTPVPPDVPLIQAADPPTLQCAVDGSTIWFRNGKPVEHAQQTVNAGPPANGLFCNGFGASATPDFRLMRAGFAGRADRAIRAHPVPV